MNATAIAPLALMALLLGPAAYRQQPRFNTAAARAAGSGAAKDF